MIQLQCSEAITTSNKLRDQGIAIVLSKGATTTLIMIFSVQNTIYEQGH